MNQPSEWGYPDLQDANRVYEALLGYGMFFDRLPPCFASDELVSLEHPVIAREKKGRSYISCFYTKHTNISYQYAIPHPESYVDLCRIIQENWECINKHANHPRVKFSHCHVQDIKDKGHIFEMNYKGVNKTAEEDLKHNFYMGAAYIVKADISNCFPSIYSHSIPWAVMGKEEAKTRWKTKAENLEEGHWSNDLDEKIRFCKDKETNGLLIGPHTSNLVSEMVLTQIDRELQKNGFEKVIRQIDDYTYFAESEENAINFIKCLEISLRNYELNLNQKKTKIVSIHDYFLSDWAKKLGGYVFPHEKEAIEFPVIDAYINYAMRIASEENDYAPITYAFRVIKEKGLQWMLKERPKELYVKKALALAIMYPYLLPKLEEYVFGFSQDIKQELLYSLPLLFNKAKERGNTDALAYCFYFAIKYDLVMGDLESPKWQKEVVEFKDCISILLAWKYAKIQGVSIEAFKEFFQKIKGSHRREQDKFWLFLYEYAENEDDIPDGQEYLKFLKRKQVKFLDFHRVPYYLVKMFEGAPLP